MRLILVNPWSWWSSWTPSWILKNAHQADFVYVMS